MRGLVELQPRARVRREDAERRAAASEHFIALVQRVILVRMHRHAELLHHRGDARLHRPAIRIRIAREMDRRRAGFADQFFERCIRRAFADDQPSALGFEILCERCETPAQEFLPRRAAPIMIALPFAEHEHGHHLIVRGHCGIQRGVVRDSQIAPEPMDGDRHGSFLI